VTPVDDAPRSEATNDLGSVDEDVATSFDLNDLFEEVDGEEITVSLKDGETLPEGLEINESGELTGTPTVPGDYEFTIIGTDEGGAQTETVISITVNEASNDAPQLKDGGITDLGDVDENDSAASFDLSAQFTDEEGDDLNFTLKDGSVLPEGLTLKPEGTLSGTPTVPGEYQFRIIVSDGNGGQTEEKFTINVVNVNEEVGAITDTDSTDNQVSENAAIGDTVGIDANAIDADGDTVSYSLSNDAGGLFAIDPSTGVVTVNGNLDYETATEHTITVVATSADGSTSDKDFTIAVQNSDSNNGGDTDNAVGAITDTDSTDNQVSENAAIGDTVGIDANAIDADGDTVSYSLSNDAGGLFAIDPSTGVVTVNGNLDYETATEHTITVVATSADGSTSDKDFTIAVSDVNDEAPVTSDSTINSMEDTVSTIVLSATDVDSPVAAFNLSSLPTNGVLYLDSAMTQQVEVDTDYSASSNQLTLYFQPNENWAGSTGFNFQAKDPNGLASDASTVTINVAAQADTPNLSGPGKIVELVDLSGVNGNDQNGVVDLTGGTIILNSEEDNSEASAAEIESGLGLTTGTLDSLADTSSSTKAVDGSFYQKTFYAEVGDTLTFNWDFIDPESAGGFDTTLYNDYAIVVINGQPVILETTNDDDQGVATYSYTVTETGPLTLGFAVVNVGDNQYDSQLIVSDLQLSGTSVPVQTVEVDLDIASSLVDVDGSESMVVTLSDFPEGTQFSQGSLVGSDWVIDLGTSSLEGLTMTLPADAGAFNLAVTATSTDSDGSTANSNLTIPVTLLDTSSVDSAQVGLQANYYGFNRVSVGNTNIESISEARTVIDTKNVDATFVATTLDYGAGTGDLARGSNLQTFLKDDAASLSRDPSSNEHALIHMEGKIYLTAGTYGFQVTADDGYQILVNGQAVAEYDNNQGATTRNPDNYSQGHQYFTIDESGAHDIEIIYWDQGGGYRFLAEITDDNGVSWNTLDESYLRSSETNADLLIGTDSGDQLVGLLVDDNIFGEEGDDTIIGNAGDDYLSGGAGSDTFVWNSGDEGTAAQPSVDVITDFETGSGGDVLDLADLLIDEQSNDLTQYLSFESDGVNTTISVKADATNVTQKIVLEGVNLTGPDGDIINQLIQDGNLDIDQ